MKWLAYIERDSSEYLRALEDCNTEDEAKSLAEIETTYIFGDGWKVDWQKFKIKITLYKVEKEITVFEKK